MANWLIDAITSPTIKPGDLPANVDLGRGTAEGFSQGLKQDVETVKTQVIEKTQIIVEHAKDQLADPLRYLSQAATKAIPAAIAASASLQYTGGQGSFANFLEPITLKTKFFEVDASRNSFIGSPLHSTRTLSTLTGYCKCQNVKLDLPGTSTEPTATIDELQIVVRYLEAGVFLE